LAKRIPTGTVFQRKYKDRHNVDCKTKTWFLKFYINGKPVVVSTGTEDYKQALTLLRQNLASGVTSRHSSELEK